ncbi:hypothetical protein DPMN_135809 [Dreissena polymorpha]|uniref:Uncharacterized protein n=1 Tax=Dreissena polymorpha TaxID=45954 RepID=A0A9D4JF04_DREPO|nr:hypothetical protein DPMN_135809 [Dreissena polymorpha]
MDDAVKGGLMQISEAVSAMTTRTSGAIQQMEKETKILKGNLGKKFCSHERDPIVQS